MKVSLSQEATQTLEQVIERIRSGNERPGRNASAVVSRIVIQFGTAAGPETLSELAGSLLSSRDKKIALLKRLRDLSDDVNDELALKILEKSVQKLNSSARESRSDAAENGCVS